MKVFILLFSEEVQAFSSIEGAKSYAKNDCGVEVKRINKSTWLGTSLSGDDLFIMTRPVFPR